MKKLKETDGSPLIFWLTICMCIILVAGAFFEYYRISVLTTKTQENIDRAVLNCAIENSYNAYNGVRTGTSSMHEFTGYNFEEAVNTVEVTSMLIRLVEIDSVGDTLVKFINGKEQYTISNINIVSINPIITSSTGAVIEFTVDYTLKVPLYYFGIKLPIITLNRTTTSKWRPMF